MSIIITVTLGNIVVRRVASFKDGPELKVLPGEEQQHDSVSRWSPPTSRSR